MVEVVVNISKTSSRNDSKCSIIVTRRTPSIKVNPLINHLCKSETNSSKVFFIKSKHDIRLLSILRMLSKGKPPVLSRNDSERVRASVTDGDVRPLMNFARFN